MRTRCCVVFLLFLAALGCGDYTIELAGSYHLMRVSGGGEFVLARDEGGAKVIVLGPSVVLYADQGDLILGKVSPVADSHDKAGFFLVDVATARVLDGLSAEELENEIERRGVGQKEMKRPTRFQSLF